jgi:hypothetical protein
MKVKETAEHVRLKVLLLLLLLLLRFVWNVLAIVAMLRCGAGENISPAVVLLLSHHSQSLPYKPVHKYTHQHDQHHDHDHATKINGTKREHRQKIGFTNFIGKGKVGAVIRQALLPKLSDDELLVVGFE